jgi:hypothetical protein
LYRKRTSAKSPHGVYCGEDVGRNKKKFLVRPFLAKWTFFMQPHISGRTALKTLILLGFRVRKTISTYDDSNRKAKRLISLN